MSKNTSHMPREGRDKTSSWLGHLRILIQHRDYWPSPPWFRAESQHWYEKALLQDIWLRNDVEHSDFTGLLLASLLPASFHSPCPQSYNHSPHIAFCTGPLGHHCSFLFTTVDALSPPKSLPPTEPHCRTLPLPTFLLDCFQDLVLLMVGELPCFQNFYVVPHLLSHSPDHCWLWSSENYGLTRIWVTGL